MATACAAKFITSSICLSVNMRHLGGTILSLRRLTRRVRHDRTLAPVLPPELAVPVAFLQIRIMD